VLPPLRTQRDKEGLREGVKQNVIQAICSDHQPHEADAKLAPFCSTQAGISALETLLPLTLRLHEEDGLPIIECIRRLTSGPADILGIDAGRLTAGSVADICIIDPQHYWRLSEDTILSQGKNTPFSGWEFKARVTHTLLKGKLVYTLE
jgi:dihydroorotase